MFISMADLQGYLKKVLDAKKQRGCCKMGSSYNIWHIKWLCSHNML